MKRINVKWVLILGLALFLLVWPGLALAQANAIQVSDEGVQSKFRQNITFTLSAADQAEIVKADLLYQIKDQIVVSRNSADFTPGQSINAKYVLDQNDPSNYLPTGAELDYWWELVDASGNKLTTDKKNLVYLDERYNWQTLQNDRLTLYWYAGSDNFGQALFDRANQALDTLQNDFGVTLHKPIKIFIYNGHDDFMGAYYVGSNEWTGGVTFSDYGVVMIGVQPNELEWGKVATTHEMSHLVLHQATDNAYSGQLTLPVWLDEGTAVYNSGETTLRADFKEELGQAITDDKLLTLRTLSSPFSSDPNEAILSYAESGAVVTFIIDHYGRQDMAKLLDTLAAGALYDEALQKSLGVNTDGLDNAYRESVNLPPLSKVAAAPAQTAAKPVSTEKAASASTPNAAESGGVAPPAQSAAEPQRGLFNFSCCLTGLIPLFVLGWAFYVKR